MTKDNLSPRNLSEHVDALEAECIAIIADDPLWLKPETLDRLKDLRTRIDTLVSLTRVRYPAESAKIRRKIKKGRV